MTDESKIQLEKFVSACDELITCKFLIAENKISKILDALAETPPVYELVSECMEQFNRDREMGKAFVQEARGNFVCNMPDEEFKIIALVFCTLADIHNGKIDFTDFVKRFFSNEENVSPFKYFIEVMILPFRNLIAEAFGYPQINLHESNSVEKSMQKEEIAPTETEKVETTMLYADAEMEGKILQFPTMRNYDNIGSLLGLDKLCVVCQRISAQMLEELDCLREDQHVEELKSICYALIMATTDRDFDMLRALAAGLKYAAKGVKCIKFLVKELEENVDSFMVHWKEFLDSHQD